MDTKKLIAALALVAIVGLGAHFYLSKMDYKHGKKWQDYKQEAQQPAEDMAEASDEAEAEEEAEETPAPTNTAPAASAPVVETPPVSDPLPPAESGGVDDILSDFDDDDESYDDSGLDSDFSGNLDEGI